MAGILDIKKDKFDKVESSKIYIDDEINDLFLDTIVNCDLIMVKNSTHNAVLVEEKTHVMFSGYNNDELLLRNNIDGIDVRIDIDDIKSMFVTFHPQDTRVLLFVIDTIKFKVD